MTHPCQGENRAFMEKAAGVFTRLDYGLLRGPNDPWYAISPDDLPLCRLCGTVLPAHHRSREHFIPPKWRALSAGATLRPLPAIPHGRTKLAVGSLRGLRPRIRKSQNAILRAG